MDGVFLQACALLIGIYPSIISLLLRVTYSVSDPATGLHFLPLDAFQLVGFPSENILSRQAWACTANPSNPSSVNLLNPASVKL